MLQAVGEFKGAAQIIVIDNGSSDATRDVVAQYRSEVPLVIRYIYEPCRRKSIALNAGLAESKGDLIAFTDDDCYVAPNWFTAIAAAFENNGYLGGAGGRVELFDCEQANCSTRTSRCPAMICSASDALYLLIGCNMIFRRRLIEKIGFFDTRLGPGTGLVAEDVDYLYRAFRTGEKMIYDPEILVYHNHGRRPGLGLDHTLRSYVRGRGALYTKHIFLGDRVLLKQATWEIRNRLKGAVTGKKPGRELRLLGWLLTGMAERIWQFS
jgi:glycosyltransferase involved in cell wall biosynthesis